MTPNYFPKSAPVKTDHTKVSGISEGPGYSLDRNNSDKHI